MKKYEAFFGTMAFVFSLSCFAQQTEKAAVETGSANTILLTDNLSNDDYVIKSYYVEERINKLFGGRITTYEVTKLDMVYTNDLGPNNTRTVIPRYVKRKTKAVEVTMHTQAPAEVLSAPVEAVKVDVLTPAETPKYINVDVVGTYAKVLEKGYKSPEMLRKVADRLYFEGNLTAAVAYYSQLFDLVKDLDVIYYYRYAQSLKAINETEKADILMKRFKSETLTMK
ncbi:hypothetical protein [Flavobacterium hungaricum]|uniref:Tetratricopeptide repeat protein n=1 Tax=Flavobacterium hungaricum TaxID=2082725 RepID=A0ABR9TI15_9FLAO|nr:hypothetical protein [Flavobacterium hungaricum]MBE8725000.1 hypothetical protein [Flavobacterium hungaricum]